MNRLAFLLCALLACGAASAQLRLPGINLPQGLDQLDSLTRPVERLTDLRELPDLRTLRLDQAATLLRRHPDLLEPDPRGAPAVRGEILAWDPSPAALQAARAAGLAVLREDRLEELGQVLVVLGVPREASTAAVLERLRALDPDGHYDFNHVYSGGGAAPPAAGPVAAPPAAGPVGTLPAAGPVGTLPAAGPVPAPAELPAPDAGTVPRLGLVDSGVQADHRALRGAAIRSWGCDGTDHPAVHGTAVAALMVGRDGRFRGAAPGATLYAADIYCDSPTGGSAERIARALAWLAREQVAVINLSLVGPPNQALERAVAAMLARGHVLVAAVGNDGPAAPPLYPASYPGVVGVTAVDRKGQPLPEAARGPQVLFAAPGNHMVSASPGAPPYRAVRGTSFAAPIVAGLLAPALARPDRARARAAIAALARQAADGAPDTVSNSLGHGIVGAAIRTEKIF
jgi:hypothetical protein